MILTWGGGGRSHSCSAKLAVVSIWRLSWTGCPICPTPMLTVDTSYWLGAQQESVSGLHVASSCDLSSTQPRSWIYRVNQEQVFQGTQAEVLKPLMTKPWKSYSVPSIPFIGQNASHRASSDSRGGMFHWWPSLEASFQKKAIFMRVLNNIKFSTIK